VTPDRCSKALPPAADPRAGVGLEARLGGVLDETAAALAAAGFDAPRRRARRLLAAALRLSATEVFAHPERPLSQPERAGAADALARMQAGEPLSRIAGTREFWGLEFALSADTLDPRPESETIVEAVLARLPQRDRRCRFLDLGTGSGCLLLALLSEYRHASGVGCDISPAAALTARHNAERLGLGARASFLAGDWAAAIAGAFDVVVANPPYIATAAIADLPPEVGEYDPIRALDGGADGLSAYRRIVVDLPRLLAPEAIFAAEIGWGQADAVAAIITGCGLGIDGITPDLAGIPRCIVARRPAGAAAAPAQKKIGMRRRRD
jgi:release factor glutamine methyltransferase